MSKKNQQNMQPACSEMSPAEAAKKTKTKRKARMVVMTVISALAVGAIVGLSVALYYSSEQSKMQAQYMRDMESVYSRSYYDLLDSANDLDVSLGKLSVAGTNERQQQLLYDIWSSSNLAGTSLSTFEAESDGIKQATRFVSQLGDYSHTLAKRLADGEPLSKQEKEKLAKLRHMAVMFKDSLKKVQSGIDQGKLFIDDNGALKDFGVAFDNFTEPSVEYPEMIYDGPFSDALADREVKALKDMKVISNEEGAALVAKYIKGAQNITFQGETPGDIDTLNYFFERDGINAFAQLSKQGGMLINFNMSFDHATANANYPENSATALQFASDAGFKDMEVVWSATANGICFVNLAPVLNDTIIYPDLIKVKIDDASGKVIGFDASHYAFNHGERTLEAPAISRSEAEARISLPIAAGGRLALIPLDETREVLTYEFQCESGGTYFIYIDAATGKEANILYVIDSAQGQMLI